MKLKINPPEAYLTPGAHSMLTLSELTSRLRAERITTSVHFFPEYGGPNTDWSLQMERSNTAGKVSITLRGPKLEELLERGLETITGVVLRGALQLAAPDTNTPNHSVGDSE